MSWYLVSYNMRRRQLLRITGVGAMAALAGCLGGEDAIYEEGNESDLVPNGPGDDWGDEDLIRDDEFNPHFDRVFRTPETDLVLLMSAEIYEDIEAAEDSFESSKATAADDEEYPLADEAFISDDGEVATCLWRHSNAIGQVAAVRESATGVTPDRQRASSYAETMFENHWES